MTTDNFTPHNGGECPVAEGTRIDVKYRDGQINQNIKVDNTSAIWLQDGSIYDIIGWRLAEQPMGDIQL